MTKNKLHLIIIQINLLFNNVLSVVLFWRPITKFEALLPIEQFSSYFHMQVCFAPFYVLTTTVVNALDSRKRTLA